MQETVEALSVNLRELRSLETKQFDSGQIHVLFVPETLQTFVLGEQIASLLHDYRAGHSVEDLCKRYSISRERLDALSARIMSAVKKGGVARFSQSFDEKRPFGAVLPKLVLMVNNYCNLKCEYCYEHETVFKKKAIDMPDFVVKVTLDKFYSAFHKVEELMFIGGEPTLSEAIIGLTCEYSTQLCNNRGYETPHFSMITNGVKMTERLFELIQRYDIQVTFSMDGPKVVQDLVRVRGDQKGSYDEVSENLRRYKSLGEDKVGIECTLTRAQHESGINVSQLIDFFAQEFGVRQTHIAAAGLKTNDPLNPFRDRASAMQQEYEAAVAKSADSFFEALSQKAGGKGQVHLAGALDSAISMIKKVVLRKRWTGMCPAGTAQLVVDAFGDVYPCWMFSGMEQFKMGNVLRDDIFNPLATRVLERFHSNNKLNNPQCSVCFARYVCEACVGNNQNITGSIEQIDETFCNTVRGSLKVILLKIGELRQDANRWNAIQRAIQERQIGTTST